MSAALCHAPLVAAEDYLAGEIVAEEKHEYVNGVVYVRAGGTLTHSQLAIRITSLLGAQLRGKPCRVFNSDLLVRVRCAEQVCFYYPDASVYCGSIPSKERVIDDATVIFEVLSPSTARTDTGEKRMAYLGLPSLEAYVLVDSAEREVTVWRQRDSPWAPAVFTDASDVITFTNAGCALSVGDIYDGIEL